VTRTQRLLFCMFYFVVVILLKLYSTTLGFTYLCIAQVIFLWPFFWKFLSFILSFLLYLLPCLLPIFIFRSLSAKLC
jgi:hypothetical protein